MSRFSGRQVTVITVSICASVVLTPTIVYAAATSTRVTIVDPRHPAHKAHVDAAGQLLVGDGHGKLTIDGKVAARALAPSRPWNPINFVIVSQGQPRSELFAATVPTKLNLTSFTVAAAASGTGTVTVDVQVYVS